MIRLVGILVVPVMAGILALAGPAAAQTYYVDLHGGYAQAHGADLDFFGGPVEEISFAGAPVAGLAFGFASHDGWRLEGELSWLRADIDSISGLAAGGEVDAWAAMANLYYGIDTGTAVTPYLGGGLGAARVALSDVSAAGGSIDDFDTVFAWQAAAGVDFRATESVVLSLEYRFMSARDLRLRDAAGGRVGMDLASSNAVGRLRFGF